LFWNVALAKVLGVFIILLLNVFNANNRTTTAAANASDETRSMAMTNELAGDFR
jgi:hypothetical protein